MVDTVPPHLAKARSLIGTQEFEGGADNPVIMAMPREVARIFPDMATYCALYTHDAIAWCAMFLGYLFATTMGIRPPFGLTDTARFFWNAAWRSWGTAVPRGQEQLGDVLCLEGHVTLYNGEEGDYYLGLGGNQSDEVKVSRYAKSSVITIRRPPAPIARVDMPSGPDLPLSNGRGSWYSQFSGKYEWRDDGDEPGSAALTGTPDDAQGVSFYDRGTLGSWFEVTAPNGVTSIEQQTDIGPNPRTGRTIDISAAAAERFGYSPRNFPTDSIFSWRPIDPPAAVANLSKVQQAIRYRDLRGKPMADPILIPGPTTSEPGASKTTITIDIAKIMEMVQMILGLVAEIKAVRAGAAQPTSATPAATPTKKTGFGTGILGVLGALVGMQQGVIAPPVGEGSSLVSLLSFALPAALSIFGVGGKVAPIISGVSSIFKLLGGNQPKA